jgi:uncharacterized protein (DUF1330 family)
LSGILAGVPAYLISEFAATDHGDSQRYANLAFPSVSQYGGRYMAQGAVPHVAEGDWPDGHRVSIVEFPTMEQLLAWYASPEYAEALAARTPAMTRRLLFIEGKAVPPST